MDTLLIVLLSLGASVALSLILFLPSKLVRKLPPGPPSIPILGNLLWLYRPIAGFEHYLLKDLCSRYGPIITIRIGSCYSIFISDRSLAHKALVQLGAAFADRPPPLPASRFLSSNQHNITGGSYGPLWRLFRRNLVSEILHPSKVRLFSPGREWVLDALFHDLKNQSLESPDAAVTAMESFQFAMFCLLILMCFGEKLDEKTIREIETAHREYLQYISKLGVFAILPSVSMYLFRNRWKTMKRLRQRQTDLFVPLIRGRKVYKENKQEQEDERFVHSYVDSLLDIKLEEEGGRALSEDEMVTLCSEFFTAGTDTTATGLQWIMAELVKNQDVQQKVMEEIETVVGKNRREHITEEDLQRMSYIKAVIKEGLRRHPPTHIVIPHSVMEDINFEGYLIPRNAMVNFLVTEMNLDESAWKEPKKFKPERFMEGGDGEDVDLTGSKEIKMMPFGVGRRICPGLGLAMLHLEYFVANLVKKFKWETVEGEDVDLSEKPEFTLVMKNPLRVRLSPRMKA